MEKSAENRRKREETLIIRDYASHPSVMRKEDPNWKFALGASPVTEGSILRIADEAGNEGFGRHGSAGLEGRRGHQFPDAGAARRAALDGRIRELLDHFEAVSAAVALVLV